MQETWRLLCVQRKEGRSAAAHQCNTPNRQSAGSCPHEAGADRRAVPEAAMTGDYAEASLRRSIHGGPWQPCKGSPQTRALRQSSCTGALWGGADVWKGLTGGMTVDPWRGPGERGTDRDVLGTSGPRRDPPPPFPPGPRATRPVTHRRRGLRREEAEEAEETPRLRGDPRARPEVPPPPPPRQPRAACLPARPPGSGSRARLRGAGVEERKEGAALATGKRNCACALARRRGRGKPKPLPVAELSNVRLRSERPPPRAPPTRSGHPVRPRPAHKSRT